MSEGHVVISDVDCECEDCDLGGPPIVEIPENTGQVILGVSDIVNSGRTHIAIADGKGRGVFEFPRLNVTCNITAKIETGHSSK